MQFLEGLLSNMKESWSGDEPDTGSIPKSDFQLRFIFLPSSPYCEEASHYNKLPIVQPLTISRDQVWGQLALFAQFF